MLISPSTDSSVDLTDATGMLAVLWSRSCSVGNPRRHQLATTGGAGGLRKAPKRGRRQVRRPQRGPNNIAQGQRNGAAVERHPGLMNITNISPVRVAQSLGNCRALSGFRRCPGSDTQGGAAAPLTLGYGV